MNLGKAYNGVLCKFLQFLSIKLNQNKKFKNISIRDSYQKKVGRGMGGQRCLWRIQLRWRGAAALWRFRKGQPSKRVASTKVLGQRSLCFRDRTGASTQSTGDGGWGEALDGP